MFYQSYGKGDKTIIFCPGGGESTKFFFKQAVGLSEKYRVILFDHRGHGASDLGDQPINLKSLADDLNDLMDHLSITHTYLAGHSLGAISVFGYVEYYGDSRLDGLIHMDMSPKPFAVTEDEYPLGWKGTGSIDYLTTVLDVNGKKSTGELLVKSVFENADEHMADMPEFLLEEEAVNATPARLAFDMITVTADQRELLSRINCPVLVAYGTAHVLFPKSVFDYMEQHLKFPTMLPVPGTHYFFIENADIFNQGVIDFIEENESRRTVA